MTLLFIQLVRLVLYALPFVPGQSVGVSLALDFFIVINEIFNVIIRSDHFYFCFTKKITWLGNHTNNNFSASLNEIVLR